eukprot:scaffold1052_cov198-Alexandrium_tamarense.AAC.28
MPVTTLQSIVSIQSTLSSFHPLLIEGHSRDSRDPSIVADRIIFNLKRSWNERNVTKPVILITQGDPLTERGISAITRNVADGLKIKRCLICLDEDIDQEHSILADRHDVSYELKYSQLVNIINDEGNSSKEDTTMCTDIRNKAIQKLTNEIERKLHYKNMKRKSLNQDPMPSWTRQYALLQEVTKVAMKQISGEVTIAHATGDIAEFSVTSFYEVGLEMGLIGENDMVNYHSDSDNDV